MTAPLIIHVGDTFNKWTVIDVNRPNDRWGKQVVLCQCTCGTIQDMTATALRQGKRGKGCLKCKFPGRLKHGHTRVGQESLTHFSWRGMLDRCENPASPTWKWYGAKGVTVCEEWHIFENFLADMGERPAKDFWLERKENSLGYCPSNCVWIPRREQFRNTSKNLLLTLHGVTHPLCVWSEITGINAGSIRSRLRYGWSVEQALTTPIHQKPVPTPTSQAS